MVHRYVFSFEDGDGRNKRLLGGKGANLCEMTRMGIDVPPGFVISTEACLNFLEEGRMPPGLMDQIRGEIAALESKTGRAFGGGENPLLVSVRSGSAMSMPGMMDTILNLGLNRATIRALYRQTGDPRFAYDSYRRFIQLFGKVALGLSDELFDEKMAELKHRNVVVEDVDLTAVQLEELADEFKEIVKTGTGWPFPEDPFVQLELAVRSVFKSWLGRRAVDYRRQFGITPDMANGTAVNVCTMVFGNMGADSATGVGFTRNPGTGENKLYGEYLINAQGEDVVAGIRTPKPIADLEQEMPGVYDELLELARRLESHYQEVQDFEFTIEKGRLYCLQTRNGKMNARAMVRTSVEMAREGVLDKGRALARVDPEVLEQLLVPQLREEAAPQALAEGLPASPGAASGRVVFAADTAADWGGAGQDVILVRGETRPEDIHGFFAARGILTAKGGKTSHAAVVARSMGKPCVSGCDQIEFSPSGTQVTIGDSVFEEGDVITIDGTSGSVYAGEVATTEAEFSLEFEELLSWADQVSTLQVRANADTPDDARRAREYGAAGVGLCRTERMFNSVDRLPIVQEMILAETEDARQRALDVLLPMQRSDFKQIFEVMEGLPVTVRLLDPPLHEFLPHAYELEHAINRLSTLKATVQDLGELPAAIKLLDPKLYARLNGTIERIHEDMVELEDAHPIDALIESKREEFRRVLALAEVNPMLGHRGVRLGLTFPEIYRMQIRAVLEAAAECIVAGIDVQPEIMIPQVVTSEELKRVHEWVSEIRVDVEQAFGVQVPSKFGSMVETVRACMRAPQLEEFAEFFSFGTNDLTQSVFSFSREDVESKFLPLYNETGILRDNPFEVLDVEGVGKLIEMTVDSVSKGRGAPEFGICGEQGGHPASIRFCHFAGLTYVSCSAPRVPVARLAAAQAKLHELEYKAFRQAA